MNNAQPPPPPPPLPPPPCEIKMEPKMSPSDVDLNFKPQMRGRSNTWPLRPREVGPSDGPDSQNSPVHEEGVGPPVMGEAGLQGKDALMNKKSSSRRNAWGNLSYADLITRAIQSSPDQRLTLSQIYDWMVQNVPYFKDKGDSTSSAGWKNSIRHSLSLHNRFMRVPNEGSGKSSWWVINPDAKPGKSPRRRAGSMETKVYEKKKNRAKKKADQLRALEQGGSSPTASSDGDLLTESPVPGFQLSPEFDFRPRASSNASSCGRLSPIQAVVEPDLHDNQVPPMSPIPWNPEMETEVGSIDSFTDQLVDSLPGSMCLTDKSLQQHMMQSSSVHRYTTGTAGGPQASAYNQYSDYTAPPPPPPPPYPEHMRTGPQTQSGHPKSAQSQSGQQNQMTTMDALSMSNHDGYGAVSLGSLQNGLDLYGTSDSLLKSMVATDPQGPMGPVLSDPGQMVQQSIQQQQQQQQQHQQQQQQQQQHNKQIQQTQSRPPMQLQDPSQAQLHNIATSRVGQGGHPCGVGLVDKKPIGLNPVTGSGNQIQTGYTQQPMSRVQSQQPQPPTNQQTQQHQQQQQRQVHRSQPQPTSTQSKLAQSGLLPQLMQSVPNNSILRAALMHNAQPLRTQVNSTILPYNQYSRDIYGNTITSTYGDTMSGLVNNINTSSTSISDCRMVSAAGANLRGMNGSIRSTLPPMGPHMASLRARHYHGQSGGMDMMGQPGGSGNPSCQQGNYPCDIDFEMLWNSTNLECDVAAVIQHELSMNENLDFNFDPLPG